MSKAKSSKQHLDISHSSIFFNLNVGSYSNNMDIPDHTLSSIFFESDGEPNDEYRTYKGLVLEGDWCRGKRRCRPWQMCNKQTPALGTRNRKQKLQKLWRNSSDPLSFIGYYDRGRRESERVREREREKKRKRERRIRRKRLHCKESTQTAHSWTLSSRSCSHLCQVHQLSVGYSRVTDWLTNW